MFNIIYNNKYMYINIIKYNSGGGPGLAMAV